MLFLPGRFGDWCTQGGRIMWCGSVTRSVWTKQEMTKHFLFLNKPPQEFILVFFNNLRWLVLTARSIDYHSWKSSAKQSELRGLLMIIDLQVPEVFILFLSEAGRWNSRGGDRSGAAKTAGCLSLKTSRYHRGALAETCFVFLKLSNPPASPGGFSKKETWRQKWW